MADNLQETKFASRNQKRACHICGTPCERWCHICLQKFCGKSRRPVLEMTNKEKADEVILILTPPYEIPVLAIKDRISELLGRAVTLADIVAMECQLECKRITPMFRRRLSVPYSIVRPPADVL